MLSNAKHLIIFRDGKPAAVILDIDEYREMLERLEDIEDLEKLDAMKQKPLKFKKLADFLEWNPLQSVPKIS